MRIQGLVTIGICFVFIVTGLGPVAIPNEAAAATKTIELRYAGWLPKGQMMERMPEYWGKELMKRTNGNVKVTNYFGQSIGKFMDFPDMIRGGTCDLAYVMPLSKGFGLLGVIDLPFLISRNAVAMDVAHGLYRQGLFSSIFEKRGFKPLYFQPTDPFYLFFRDNKVKSLSELRKMKLRGVTPPQIKLIKALGAAGIVIPTTDLYMALDRGTVDGLITAPEYCLAAKLYEVLKYCAWEPVGVPCGAVVMNLDVWKSLPADIQVIIEELNQEIRYKFMGMQRSAAEYREELTKRGIEIYDISPKEAALWRTTVNPLIENWIADMKQKGHPSEVIVSTVHKIINQY